MTADDIIAAIENLQVRGAYRITRAAVKALTLRAQELVQADWITFADGLRAAAERIREAQPSMPSVANGLAYVLAALDTAGDGTASPQRTSERIADRAAAFLARLDRAQRDVITIGSALVQDGDTIFVHSYSGTLLAILRRAWENGRRFQVIGTESRPYGEGRALAAELVQLGVPYTLIIDAAFGSYLPRADKVLVGVDAILADGGIVNKIGTYPIALTAQAHGVPVYAAGLALKFSHASRRGERLPLMERPDNAGIAPPELAEAPNLRVENRIFEVIPASVLTAVVTEHGVLPPTTLVALLCNESAQNDGKR